MRPRQDITLDIKEVALVLWTDQILFNMDDNKISEELVGGKPSTMQEMLALSQALAIAVDKGFMKREHAGAVWKRLLVITRIDTTKKKEEVSKKDGIS